MSIWAVTIFWTAVSGASYEACIGEVGTSYKLCNQVSAGSNQYEFADIKKNTDYVFTYKEIKDGVSRESAPMLYHTGPKVPTCPAPKVCQDAPKPCPPPVVCPPALDPNLLYAPDGKSYRNHWCIAREMTCALERDLFAARKKKWKACSFPYEPVCNYEINKHLP